MKKDFYVTMLSTDYQTSFIKSSKPIRDRAILSNEVWNKNKLSRADDLIHKNVREAGIYKATN